MACTPSRGVKDFRKVFTKKESEIVILVEKGWVILLGGGGEGHII